MSRGLLYDRVALITGAARGQGAASDDSSYCTGTALLADGGSMAGPLGWTPPEGGSDG